MPAITIGDYFAHNRLRKIGKGSGMVVYGARDVVVKRYDHIREARHLLASNRMLGRSKGKGLREAMDDASQAASKIQQRRLDEVQRTKEALGGLVADFQVPDQLCVKVWNFYVLPETETFYGPIVQRRMGKGTDLKTKLKALAKDHDLEGLGALVDQWFALHLTIIRRGMFMGDPLPSNYTCTPEGIRITDTGSLWSSKNLIVRGMSGEDYPANMDRNYSLYERLIENAFGRGTSAEQKGLQEVLNRLRRAFDRLFIDPRLVKTVWGRVRGTPVPDVFPLEV